MIRDVVFELNELLEQSSSESDEYRAGLLHAIGILHHQLRAFEIDQTAWPRPLIDPEAWFLARSHEQ
jgi:hypothetical protein